MKKLALLAWLGLLLTAIALVFWYTEYRYQLPTPLPESYHPVSTGEIIQLPSPVGTEPSKPVFLHFCSDKKTNYAETALTAITRQQTVISFNKYALTAYGCKLPQSTNP